MVKYISVSIFFFVIFALLDSALTSWYCGELRYLVNCSHYLNSACFYNHAALFSLPLIALCVFRGHRYLVVIFLVELFYVLLPVTINIINLGTSNIKATVMSSSCTYIVSLILSVIILVFCKVEIKD